METYLVNELKLEHTALLNLFEEIKESGSTDSKEILLRVKKSLLEHLNKEDKKLYPVLRKAAISDENIARKLKTFAKDMDEISAFAFNFFNKVENNLYTQLEYAKDFGRLVSTLLSRIRREETILYNLYEDCISRNK